MISSTSSHTMRLMRSLQVSLMAVSGAILITLVPLPRKKALVVPAQISRSAAHIPCALMSALDAVIAGQLDGRLGRELDHVGATAPEEGARGACAACEPLWNVLPRAAAKQGITRVAGALLLVLQDAPQRPYLCNLAAAVLSRPSCSLIPSKGLHI